MGQPPKSPWQPTLVSNPDTKLAAHGQGLSAPHLHGFQHSGQECSKPQKSITDFLTLTKLQKANSKGHLVATRQDVEKNTVPVSQKTQVWPVWEMCDECFEAGNVGIFLAFCLGNPRFHPQRSIYNLTALFHLAVIGDTSHRRENPGHPVWGLEE